MRYDEENMSESTIQPNTTQVPNILLDEWMPRLSDVELRLLLIVVRQTLGWIEDPEKKTRKTEDWISGSQLVAKSGRSRKHISKGMKALIEDHQLVIAVDSKGRLLDTADKRKAKFGKIFYRLNVHAPALSLFDKPRNGAVSSRASKGLTIEDDGTKRRTQKGRTTKETQEQNKILAAEPHPVKENTPNPPKKPHSIFMAFWDRTVLATRGFKPKITAADGMNLKRVLDLGVDESLLEQIALYYLAHHTFRTFSPSISTLLSAGILNGLLNRSKNDPEFRKDLDSYVERFIPRTDPAAGRTYEVKDMRSAMTTLLEKFRMPKSALAVSEN